MAAKEKTGIEKARETSQKIKNGGLTDAEKKEAEKKLKKKVSPEKPPKKAKKKIGKKKIKKAQEGKVLESQESSPDTQIEPATIKNNKIIFTDKQVALIKAQVAKNATEDEFKLFMMMAYRTRLDPLLNQLYFIKYKEDSKPAYVTSIDGYRIIAHRTGEFAGIDEPKYTFMGNSQVPNSCTVTVYKRGSERGFSATVYFNEYSTGMNMWKKMPKTMIAKVAEAHALRKAFPQDLSGIYTTDEMEQAKQDQNKQISQPTPKRPDPNDAPITSKEWSDVVRFMKEKGKTMEDFAAFCEKKFGHTNPKKLTHGDYNSIMEALTKVPDPIPDELPEGWDMDEIDEGIKKMEEEENKS